MFRPGCLLVHRVRIFRRPGQPAGPDQDGPGVEAGGALLLDVIHYPAVVRERLHTTVLERDGDLLLDRHQLDPLTGRTIVQRTIIRDGRVRHGISWFVRLFTFTELRDWLLTAGFSTVAAFDEHGKPLTAESARMIVVAQN
jgi:hypothetical protein